MCMQDMEAYQKRVCVNEERKNGSQRGKAQDATKVAFVKYDQPTSQTNQIQNQYLQQ